MIKNIKKAYLVGIGVLVLAGLFAAYCFILHPHVISAYDIWMGFNNTNYSNIIDKQFLEKSSDELLRIYSYPTSLARKLLALGVLSKRGDERAIPILKHLIEADNKEMAQVAMYYMARYGERVATPVLIKVFNEYKNKKYDLKNKSQYDDYRIYEMSIDTLSAFKNEEVFRCLKLFAQNGTPLEIDIAVAYLHTYNDDRHLPEVLNLYRKLIANSKGKYKYIVGDIKRLNRPEAIPLLKDLAEKEPWNRKEAEEAINYIESLKANPK